METSVSAHAQSEDPLVPPASMLFDGTSSEEQFKTFGEGFLQYVLVQRAHLAPSASFLDIGCGNGSVARALTRFLSAEGRYEGLDINGPGIEWLQHRYAQYRNFRFTHANVYNKAYNAGGTVQGDDFRLPYDDASFDVVLLKSVFTHMLPQDVRRYTSEIARVLRPGGRSVTTYFLLNDESRRLLARGRGTFSLKFDWNNDPLCRVESLELPESVTAHDEQRIRQLYAEFGFDLAEVSFGNWCGRGSIIGFQDLIVAVRELTS